MANQKARNERLHFRRRLLERYGESLGEPALERLIQQMRTMNPALLRPLQKMTNSRTLFALRFREQWIPVVWNNKSHQPVTALPPRQLDPYREWLAETKE